jgi:hypothetical protein
VARYAAAAITIDPHPVAHTSHPTFGYLILTDARRVVSAPEFFTFPRGHHGPT